MGQDPEAIRQDIERTRAEMTETVEAIGYKADVPARSKEALNDRVEGVKETVTDKVDTVKETVTDKVDTVKDKIGMAKDKASGTVGGATSRVGDATPSTGQAKAKGRQALGTTKVKGRQAVNAAKGSAELDGPLHEVANAAPYVFDDAALRRSVDRIRELADAEPTHPEPRQGDE